ncbi:MAG TPA: deoxycytidylate deaminase [Alphaproteobacteria bacterium]|nr:deoxycytidylate deaminase [Alphaproteobacteria bacterium]
MNSIALTHMQHTLEIAPKSPHPTNKIAATIFGVDKKGGNFSLSRTNHWPDLIFEKIGTTTKIGNSSGTIHAETDCILHSLHATEGASICITDPFCPNCAKNMAEAGIKNIYIDKNGFDKDFFRRRGDHFDAMSMQICERAGMNVFAIDLENEAITSILEISNTYNPVEDSPVIVEPIESFSEAVFKEIIATSTLNNKRRKFSVALVENKAGKKFGLTVRAHAAIGYTLQKPEEALDLLTPIGKYSFIQEPVNRLMMHIARHGYKMADDFLYCSQVPTSREQVNLVGANIKRITIGDIQKSRDVQGLKAMEQLKTAGILDYS